MAEKTMRQAKMPPSPEEVPAKETLSLSGRDGGDGIGLREDDGLPTCRRAYEEVRAGERQRVHRSGRKRALEAFRKSNWCGGQERSDEQAS
ncbi:MAG: hypothetical protein M3315_09325 [Actinomycetota bacterium]|nr:hypothetical protein [Actinomycetota bacterium]